MPAADVVLLIADIDLIHHSVLDAVDVVTLITLPHPTRTPEPGNTIMLTFEQPERRRLETRTVDGARRITSTVTTAALMNGLHLGAALSNQIGKLVGAPRAARHTPLFCATRHDDGWHVYSRAHSRSDRWCFIRTSATPIPPTGDDLSWLQHALTGHTTHAGLLNSHHCTVPPGFAGKEVETKFTLPADTDIWSLALEAHTRMSQGDIPAMVQRFGQDFEMSDLENHLFEVHAPTDQTGYVSFMNARPGWYWIKRKRFTADTLIRQESIIGEIQIPGSLNSYVRDVLELQTTALPPFRRIRYDVMCESITTGNQFCFMFDRCTLRDDRNEMLVQCEIEYIRTRSVLPPEEALVLNELESLTSWTSGFLTDHAITSPAHYYSKMSFLRDLVHRRPELAITTYE